MHLSHQRSDRFLDQILKKNLHRVTGGPEIFFKEPSIRQLVVNGSARYAQCASTRSCDFFTSQAFYVCGILTECSFALHICRRETFKGVQTDFDAHLRRSQHFGRENIQ